MAEIMVGEQIVNKAGEIGKIISVTKDYMVVQFGDRVAKFLHNAFKKGFLSYKNEALQSEIDKNIKQVKIEEERKAEENRIAEEKEHKEQEERHLSQLKNSMDEGEVRFNSVSVRLDSIPVNLNSVSKKDKEQIREIFNECDKDIKELYSSFHPRMLYLKYTSHSKSKYCVGFLCKYLNTYVFRVFSRNDVYKKGIRTGVTVMESDTTEIFRILYINGTIYSFAKNISYSDGYFNNTKAYNTWHTSDMSYGVVLNAAIRQCDSGYLNDYIAEKNVNCLQYVKLLFPALHNNKAEIVFKNKLFSSTSRIDNIVKYLEEFSSKQIDFACKNNVVNTLPMIKQYGCKDLRVLHRLEEMIRKRRWGDSAYKNLQYRIQQLHLDCSDLDERLIAFLKKVECLELGLYEDYVRMLGYQRGVTIRDFFDKDYIEKHDILMHEEMVGRDKNLQKKNEKYMAAAKELSWIDRKDNGYYIIVPKNIKEFKYEGTMQHNCVYSAAYFLKVINRESIIVFLRKEKDVPYVTIEFDYETFEVIQARGKYNQSLDSHLHQYVVDLGKRLYYEYHSR